MLTGQQPNPSQLRGKRIVGQLGSAIALVMTLCLPQTIQATGEPRPWELWVRPFVRYDTNVPLASENLAFSGKKGSLGAGIEMDGIYRLFDENPWQAGIGVYIFQSFYGNSGADDFNLTSAAPRLFANYRFQVFDRPASADLVYVYSRDYLSGSDYSHNHQFQLNLSLMRHPGIQSELRLGLLNEDFNYDGTLPSVTSRDALQHGIGVGETYYLIGDTSFRIRYQYIYNDADGDNYQYSGHKFYARYQIPVPITGFTTSSKSRLSLEGKYEKRDYTDYVLSPKRDQDIWAVKGTFSMPVDKKLVADFSYTYLEYDSNRPIFNADRHRIELGFTYRF